MSDLISRQAVIDAIQGISRLATLPDNDAVVRMSAVEYILFNLPSAQSEITDEQAIEHLQSSGWMQNHDREMYDMGFKEQLADDSGSYDSLLPSAQPEQKKGEWILSDLQDENEVANDNFYYVCSCCGKGDTHAKSAEVPYCWWCGARMRGEENEAD